MLLAGWLAAGDGVRKVESLIAPLDSDDDLKFACADHQEHTTITLRRLQDTQVGFSSDANDEWSLSLS